MLILMGSVTAINTIPIETQSRGNTLYVGGSGPGNYTRIQDAIDNASNGDTVFVYDGIYDEYLEINRAIHLRGESKNNTILQNMPPHQVVNITADQTFVEALTIQGM